EYERRVLALEPKVLEAEKTRKGQAKWLTLFMSAQDRGSDGEFAKAFQILDKLEGLLNAPPLSKPPGPEAAPGAAADSLPEFAELWRQSKGVWQDAVDTVNSQLERLRSALLNVTKEKDPDLAPLIPQLKEGT